MRRVKGIVTHVQGKGCILLTPDGEFLKLNRIPHSVRVGQELECSTRSYSWITAATAVAVILLVALVLKLNPLSLNSSANLGYITLDINPSIELAVNSNGKVVKVSPLNQDARIVLDKLHLTKLDVNQAVTEILAEATKDGFITAERDNLVLAAITGDSVYNFDQVKLEQIVLNEIEKMNLPVQYAVITTTLQLHTLADNNGISQGKYYIYNLARVSGKAIELKDLKQDGIFKTLKAKGLQLRDLEVHAVAYDPAKKIEDAKLVLDTNNEKSKADNSQPVNQLGSSDAQNPSTERTEGETVQPAQNPEDSPAIAEDDTLKSEEAAKEAAEEAARKAAEDAARKAAEDAARKAALKAVEESKEVDEHREPGH